MKEKIKCELWKFTGDWRCTWAVESLTSYCEQSGAEPERCHSSVVVDSPEEWGEVLKMAGFVEYCKCGYAFNTSDKHVQIRDPIYHDRNGERLAMLTLPPGALFYLPETKVENHGGIFGADVTTKVLLCKWRNEDDELYDWIISPEVWNISGELPNITVIDSRTDRPVYHIVDGWLLPAPVYGVHLPRYGLDPL